MEEYEYEYKNYKEKQKSLMQLPNGQIIDRSKICFGLIPSRADKNIVTSMNGTSYRLSEDGSLRRMYIKETREERKARKREMRKRND